MVKRNLEKTVENTWKDHGRQVISVPAELWSERPQRLEVFQDKETAPFGGT